MLGEVGADGVAGTDGVDEPALDSGLVGALMRGGAGAAGLFGAAGIPGTPGMAAPPNEDCAGGASA
ncbi:hypothetical protein [Mycobacterium sp. 852002-51152_SCH6134967]|uniref:hypothetical protein n=1 Tax=Mycobacterium sp. 852002-51152_SCH6134967 TaxID=1834096 RepID=UPI0012E85AC4|nr:hypothetical protein [Mycobacterium sp. 852002-51152_SCH6134967]